MHTLAFPNKSIYRISTKFHRHRQDENEEFGDWVANVRLSYFKIDCLAEKNLTTYRKMGIFF